MEPQRLKATQVPLAIKRGETGLYYGTSKLLKGLLVAGESPDDVIKKTPQAISALYLASGASYVDVRNAGLSNWIARPTYPNR